MQPILSVVTPFHNTAPYLAQCIESVLGQAYQDFEYVLVDNCSTDRSLEIAESYALRDPRIRLIRRSRLLPQVENYNAALAEISGASLYCKIVQADDYIFPDCLRLMVKAFEQSESIGLVSSYWLKGAAVKGSGLPESTTYLPGPDLGRMYLRTGLYLFGSPSTVMYRASLVRGEKPFYNESLLHEDTEKCLEILEHWDFGFVHQVLSFLRTENQSISATARDFDPNALDRYILVRRFAPRFLDAEEAAALIRASSDSYYEVLAKSAIRFPGRSYWDYHDRGLRTLGEHLRRGSLALHIARRLLWLLANPGMALTKAFRIGRSGSMQASGSEPAAATGKGSGEARLPEVSKPERVSREMAK